MIIMISFIEEKREELENVTLTPSSSTPLPSWPSKAKFLRVEILAIFVGFYTTCRKKFLRKKFQQKFSLQKFTPLSKLYTIM